MGHEQGGRVLPIVPPRPPLGIPEPGPAAAWLAVEPQPCGEAVSLSSGDAVEIAVWRDQVAAWGEALRAWGGYWREVAGDVP